jgi:hypothetical protein
MKSPIKGSVPDTSAKEKRLHIILACLPTSGESRAYAHYQQAGEDVKSKNV